MEGCIHLGLDMDVGTDGWVDELTTMAHSVRWFTFLCWMVKLTGWEKLECLVLGRKAVMMSEFISVWFSVLKKPGMRSLSMSRRVRTAAAADPAKKTTNTFLELRFTSL